MPTRKRVEENEQLYRDVNDRIREISESFFDRWELVDFACECGRHCRAQVRLTLDEYAEVRSDPAAFVVAPGHELPELEEGVRRHERYVVVVKRQLEDE